MVLACERWLGVRFGSIFFPVNGCSGLTGKGSQRIAEKYAKDCQKFARGRINRRRNLGAEFLSRHEVSSKVQR